MRLMEVMRNNEEACCLSLAFNSLVLLSIHLCKEWLCYQQKHGKVRAVPVTKGITFLCSAYTANVSEVIREIFGTLW